MPEAPRRPTALTLVMVIAVASVLMNALGVAVPFLSLFGSGPTAEMAGTFVIAAIRVSAGWWIAYAILEKKLASKLWPSLYLVLLLLAEPTANVLAHSGYHTPPPELAPGETLGAAAAELLRLFTLLGGLIWIAASRRTRSYLHDLRQPATA